MGIHHCLVAIYGENVMLMQMIRKLCQQFKTGWESIDVIFFHVE